MSLRRPVTLIWFLLIVLPASAGTYVVPVYTDPCLAYSQAWISRVAVTNATHSPITVSVTNIFPYDGTHGCRLPLPRTVRPHTSEDLSVYCDHPGPVAVEMEADGPLEVTADVRLFEMDNSRRGREISREAIGVARAWLESHVDFYIPEVAVDSHRRSNLYVVNPSADILYVEFQRLSDFSTPVHTATIAPHASLALPMLHDSTYCGSGDVLDAGCPTQLRIRGTGRFYAAVSVVDNFSNMATFRTPVQ